LARRRTDHQNPTENRTPPTTALNNPNAVALAFGGLALAALLACLHYPSLAVIVAIAFALLVLDRLPIHDWFTLLAKLSRAQLKRVDTTLERLLELAPGSADDDAQ
jgi:hypothetical protein